MKRQAGFSLVELMIVVAIMAILAAIAIPSFLRFSMRAKTAEATSNLNAIRTCEESYRAEEDVYLVCPPNPTAWAPGPGASTPRVWDAGAAGDDFEDIGFEPDGSVRYQYATTSAAATTFIATATGDIDEDGTPCVFTINKALTTYPKAIKTGDDF